MTSRSRLARKLSGNCCSDFKLAVTRALAFGGYPENCSALRSVGSIWSTAIPESACPVTERLRNPSSLQGLVQGQWIARGDRTQRLDEPQHPWPSSMLFAKPRRPCDGAGIRFRQRPRRNRGQNRGG